MLTPCSDRPFPHRSGLCADGYRALQRMRWRTAGALRGSIRPENDGPHVRRARDHRRFWRAACFVEVYESKGAMQTNFPLLGKVVNCGNYVIFTGLCRNLHQAASPICGAAGAHPSSRQRPRRPAAGFRRDGCACCAMEKPAAPRSMPASRRPPRCRTPSKAWGNPGL